MKNVHLRVLIGEFNLRSDHTSAEFLLEHFALK